MTKIKDCKQKPLLLDNDNLNNNYYLIAFSTQKIKEKNITWKKDDSVLLIFIDDKNTFIVKGKDLKNKHK